uniref:non-specific serine/threonine protein kinase n=1 Tax=Schizophyllum commune (strain H4-8 / FGSC 9210) TaxID=578458 RepID=D8QJL2_SCHCM
MDRDVEEDKIKPYVVTGHLGKGSFAVVYKGYNEDTHKQVAIKTVKRETLGTGKLLDNLQLEIDILKSLSHRHITRLLDIIRAPKNIYLIMEYCAGGDLTNYIKKRGRVDGLEYTPLPTPANPHPQPQYYPHPPSGGLAELVVRSFLRQLARALKFLRHRKLIHRDIKPQNLLLHPAGEDEYKRGHPLGVPVLKLADFGFARSLPNAMMAQTLCGSPLYMAPEILKYEPYGPKVDLWSTGAVLYEMAVGKPPFRAQNHIELINKIEKSKGIRFPDEEPQTGKNADVKPVPQDIKDLIRALLRRLPIERADYEQFFSSPAMQNSKFPRPEAPKEEPGAEERDTPAWTGSVPDHHKVIPPEVLDPHAMIPPSKFNFRRQSLVGRDDENTPEARGSASPQDLESLAGPSRPPRRPPNSEPVDGSSAEAEEYVLVDDTQALEFDRAVDQIRDPSRRPSQQGRQLHARRVSTYGVPREIGRKASLGERKPSMVERRSSGGLQQRPDHRRSSTYSGQGTPQMGSPVLDEDPSAEFLQERPSTRGFPPPSPGGSSPSRAAASALNRALSLASKKLFGTPSRSPSDYAQASPSRSPTDNANATPSRDADVASSPRRAQILRNTDEERDPREDALLEKLEVLAQKTEVLTNWADEMYKCVVETRQNPSQRRDAKSEAEYNAVWLGLAGKNERSLDLLQVTCVAVYLLLMGFAQKGIDELSLHQDEMLEDHPDAEYVVSEGFDDALCWFRERFLKCHERAKLVKTWLPANYNGPRTWLDQLVYDRALALSRLAARKELLDQATTPNECEKLYEESLWCLYALQDELLQTGNELLREDSETVATWIKRTKLRLVRCRARMKMNDRDRMNDVRADENLSDAPRVPAPWDAPAT